jgi:hypothetical protein
VKWCLEQVGYHGAKRHTGDGRGKPRFQTWLSPVALPWRKSTVPPASVAFSRAILTNDSLVSSLVTLKRQDLAISIAQNHMAADLVEGLIC